MNPTLRWVSIDQMQPSLLCQGYSEISIAAFTHMFRVDLCDPLTVFPRDNVYRVIDGVRRLTAVQRLGWGGELRCWVFDELTAEQEAKLFLQLNTVRSPA